MKISKTRDVITPNRGTDFSAGIDFYVPRFDESFLKDLESKNKGLYFSERSMSLNPGERVLIPSGIKTNFEGDSKMLIALNKSGVSTKKGLDVLACVIDQDYQGEIHISLVNTSNDVVIICENEKIVQMVMVPILYESVEEVSIEELWIDKTTRGDGGFGSTNK